MAKPGARSTQTPNLAGNAGSGNQAVSTHPNTRTIGTQVGAVSPTKQPIPDIKAAEANRQKGQSPLVPVSLATVGNATTEAEQRHQPKPVTPDVAVNTEH
jgi:hypothetical protein